MTGPAHAAFGLTGDQATVLVDVLGGGGSVPPAEAEALLAVVEDDAALIDLADLPPLGDGSARVRLVTPGEMASAVAAAGWTLVAVSATAGRLVALAHGPSTTAWPALAAHLESERAAAIARAELVDGILATLGGQYAVEHAARAVVAEGLAAAAVAELATEREVRAHLEATVTSQAAEIGRLTQEAFVLKQRLVGPDGAVSPRVAAALAQSRRVRRALRRRLAARQ